VKLSFHTPARGFLVEVQLVRVGDAVEYGSIRWGATRGEIKQQSIRSWVKTQTRLALGEAGIPWEVK
jgi:hypothetical protein